MRFASKFAIAGFAIGIAVAFFLAMNNNGHTSATTLFLLWPTAVFGLGATGWSDGHVFHAIQSIVVFAGNGIVYGLVAFGLSSLVNNSLKKSRSGTKS